MIVDAHQHFWDPARGDYGWLMPDNPIHRVFSPSDLRPLMDDVHKSWKAVEALVQRGSASSYDQAVRALIDLAQGYALTSSRKEFDRALRGFVARHAKRGALLRRLIDAGLWSR